MPHAGERPATRRVLDSAQRLVDGARRRTGLQVDPAVVGEAITEVERTARLTLDPDNAPGPTVS